MNSFTQKSFCMHFIYMHDITPLHNLLKFNDVLHFYSWWMHNEQSLGLLIRLLLACAYLLKVGMCVNEILGFCKEKNHTWKPKIYEIMGFCVGVLLFCLWKGGAFFQTFPFQTQLYPLLPISHIYFKHNSID